jgi:hypothetical protein
MNGLESLIKKLQKDDGENRRHWEQRDKALAQRGA